MTSVCYGHFMVEHYRGHHPRAATQADPASARYGESLYHFLPRSLWGSWVSGWRSFSSVGGAARWSGVRLSLWCFLCLQPSIYLRKQLSKL